MSFDYSQKPAVEEVSRFFYRGLHLYLSPEATSAQIKDWWLDCGRVMRWKLAELNGVTPDMEGRIVVPPAAKGKK